MPTYRELFPQYGAIGEKAIINILKNLYLRDCLLILSKLSRHYYKYIQTGFNIKDADKKYNCYCLDLIDDKTKKVIFKNHYDVIFPELSILHLIKLALKYCDDSSYTETEEFSKDVLYKVGKCLLITNSVMGDWQTKGSKKGDGPSKEIMVNFTKQLIADKNFDITQKLYQTFFLYCKYLKEYKEKFDIEKYFQDKYGVSSLEYNAFLFLTYATFLIKNNETEDWETPHFNIKVALQNLKQKYKYKLLENLILQKSEYKKIDKNFFNVTRFTQKPFIELGGGNVIPISLRRLFLGITDGVYFDLLDSIPDQSKKNDFSHYFGQAIEDYFVDVMKNINKNVVLEFEYTSNRNRKDTPDAILAEQDGLVFLECKKRQFHTLEFLHNGNKEMYYERLTNFCYKPLKQLCDRIKDFRNKEFTIKNESNHNKLIYPIIIYPISPPFFSGGWDMFDLNQYVLNDYFKEDTNVALPEFMDFSELECIEVYLKKNPQVSFVDLIKAKRSYKEYHNSNWLVFLYNNNMAFQNKRLIKEHFDYTKQFKDLLFNKNKKTTHF